MSQWQFCGLIGGYIVFLRYVYVDSVWGEVIIKNEIQIHVGSSD